MTKRETPAVRRTGEVIKAMLALNAAGFRAILQPDGTLVSEPVASKPADDADLIDWKRPA